MVGGEPARERFRLTGFLHNNGLVCRWLIDRGRQQGNDLGLDLEAGQCLSIRTDSLPLGGECHELGVVRGLSNPAAVET